MRTLIFKWAFGLLLVASCVLVSCVSADAAASNLPSNDNINDNWRPLPQFSRLPPFSPPLAHPAVPRFTATVYLDSLGSKVKLRRGVLDHRHGAAWAVFDDGEFDGSPTGWGVLYVNSTRSQRLDDATKMYAAGYVEGALTAPNIYNTWLNYMFGWFGANITTVPDQYADFVKQQIKFLRTQVSSNQTSSYWQEVGLILSQFDGLVQGYADNCQAGQQLDELALMMLNMNGDFITIQSALSPQDDGSTETGKPLFRRRANRRMYADAEHIPAHLRDNLFDWGKYHCSSLVRVLPDNADLFFSHDTWGSYNTAIRIYKHYHFWLIRDNKKGSSESDGGSDRVVDSESLPASRRVSFSSSPAFLSSVDDFYLTNRGLAVMETTNEFYNNSLFPSIVPTGVVMSWIRCMVATYTATSGAEWTSVFAQYNSGTYNNQWIIVDLKLFTPHQPRLADNTLWISEQLPLLVHSEDMTEFLREHGYWASYNVPFFDDVRELSGFNSMEKKFGIPYSWYNCSRACIFRRDAPGIQHFGDFTRVMRYNDWQHDPFSYNDPVPFFSSVLLAFPFLSSFIHFLPFFLSLFRKF